MLCGFGSTAPGLRSKKAQRDGRLIVFVDESGISERPTRCAHLAPKGQTPIIQFHFNWTHVSVICRPDTHELPVQTARRQHQEGRDRRIPQSAQSPSEPAAAGDLGWLESAQKPLVRDYLDSLHGHIQIAFLPPYAPDLNPVEYPGFGRPSSRNRPSSMPMQWASWSRPGDLGLVEQTLRNWVKAAAAGKLMAPGAKPVTPGADGAVQDCARRTRGLKMHVEILKKATAYFAKDAL